MKRSVDIVIAHYKENLSWVSSIDEKYNLYVYSKHYDKDSYIAKQNTKIVKLENIGRESHSYLYHIVSRYDEIKNNPNGVTIFLQGCIKDHLPYYTHNGDYNENSFITNTISDISENGISKSSAKIWDVGYYSANYDFYIPQEVNLTLQVSGLKFGEWFEKNVGLAFPENDKCYWWIGALFGVINEKITTKPKEYYKHLLDQLQHVNPDIGHYFERSWFYIMGGSVY